MFDRYLAELDALGAAVVVTADHGMKPKHNTDGSPAVIYVQDLMDDWLGKDAARVILPITDPYVVHHGALGSFATAYLPEGADRGDIIAKLAGAATSMLLVVTRKEEVNPPLRASGRPDRRHRDDLGREYDCIGTSAHRHDLAALKEPLRSHGGLTEQEVPFIVNRRVDLPSAPKLRNFDAFFYATTAAVQ